MSVAAAGANCAWLASSLPAWGRFCHALRRPAETQQRLLVRLLNRHASSAYGRAIGFNGIKTYEQFADQVPVVTYEELRPWIGRIMQGESSVLADEPVTHLLPTSGSSGGRKLIPFTAGLQQEFNAAISPWIVDLSIRHPSIAAGTAYWSISPALPAADPGECRVPIGFQEDSEYLGGVRRRLVETTFAVPSALRLVRDLQSFRHLTLLCLLRRRDLRLISVWHPSFLVLLLDALLERWDELIDAVATGKCCLADSCHPAVRKMVHAGPMAARAEELRRAGPRNPEAIWPRLKLVSCWGDGQSTIPMTHLQTLLPHTTLQAKGLLATEAFVSIPFQGKHPVAITSHFYEFEGRDGTIRRTHELVSGQTYSVIVTTGGGLWRYRLGDLVRAEDFVETTPSLRFVGREGYVVDYCGEKLAEDFVAEAMAAACSVFQFVPRFGLLAPDKRETGVTGYTLFLEGDMPDGFMESLDAELRRNPHYALCCDLGQLAPLRCFEIAQNAYADYVRASMEGGGPIGGIKPQSLSRREDWRTVFTGHYR